MTKRVGRKRLATAKRQPNGRVRHVRASEPEGYSPTLVKRMADMAARRLADAFYGTALGLAYLTGGITREQAAAGQRWRQARADWIKAIDAGRLDLGSLALGEVRSRIDPPPESEAGCKMTEHDIAACKRYHRLEAILLGCGGVVERNTRALAEAPGLRSMNHEELRSAVAGLEALHRYLHGTVNVAA